MIWNAVSSVLSLAAVVVAVTTFLLDRKRTQRVETIEELNQIFSRYYEIRDLDLDTNYRTFCSFVSYLDRFAYAVNCGVYDKKIVAKRASRLFDQIDKTFMRSVIKKRREQYKKVISENEPYYKEIDIMLEAIRKLNIADKR